MARPDTATTDTTAATARPYRSRLLAPGRLIGLDLARGIALLAMMAAHIVPFVDASGEVGPAVVTAGRASALFAVVAGMSLVLAYHPEVDRPLAHGVRRAIVARSVVIALVGFVLAELESGVAIILVQYALLFVLGSIVIGLRGRTLALLAVGWVLIAPVIAHVVRDGLPPGAAVRPTLGAVEEPGRLLEGQFFTGVYPVFVWFGYLLVGMAVARLPLRQTATAIKLLAAGVVLAVGAKLVSALLLGPFGGRDHLSIPPGSVLLGRDVDVVLQTGMYGRTPTNTWWWLAVSSPHSGVPLDLIHTIGTSLAVIGACLLVAVALSGRTRLLLVPLAAVGSMTLTLYSLHVVMLAIFRDARADVLVESPTAYWWANVVAALVLATCWQLTGRRGPLEGLAAGVSRMARGASR